MIDLPDFDEIPEAQTIIKSSKTVAEIIDDADAVSGADFIQLQLSRMTKAEGKERRKDNIFLTKLQDKQMEFILTQMPDLEEFAASNRYGRMIAKLYEYVAAEYEAKK